MTSGINGSTGFADQVDGAFKSPATDDSTHTTLGSNNPVFQGRA